MKRFFLSLMLASAFAGMNAATLDDSVEDSGAKGVNISVIPFGKHGLYVSNKEHENDYVMKSVYTVEVSKEIGFGSMSSFFFLDYSHGELDYDNCDFNLPSGRLIPDFIDETYYGLHMGFLVGNIINKKGRVKFPFYLGPTLGYENCGPIHNLTLNMQAMLRMKVYLTRKFGLFVGARGSYGLGSKSAGEYGISAGKGEGLTLSAIHLGLEAGITFAIN